MHFFWMSSVQGPVQVDKTIDVKVEEGKEEQEDASIIVVRRVDPHHKGADAHNQHKDRIQKQDSGPEGDLAEVAQGKEDGVGEAEQVDG